MTHLRRRIIPPDVFADPYLSPTDKRLFVIGLQLVAEDSGCVLWDARTLRAALLVHDEVSPSRVEELMSELVDEGRVWPYGGDGGKRCAFLPDFKVWQAKKGWFNAPEEVPLPAGITITGYEDKHNTGRVKYGWPSTREDLAPNEAKSTNEVNPSKQSKEPNVGVHHESTGSEHPVPDVPGGDEPW